MVCVWPRWRLPLLPSACQSRSPPAASSLLVALVGKKAWQISSGPEEYLHWNRKDEKSHERSAFAQFSSSVGQLKLCSVVIIIYQIWLSTLNTVNCKMLSAAVLTQLGPQWQTGGRLPPQWTPHPSMEPAEGWWRRYRLLLSPVEGLFLAPGERGGNLDVWYLRRTKAHSCYWLHC